MSLVEGVYASVGDHGDTVMDMVMGDKRGLVGAAAVAEVVDKLLKGLQCTHGRWSVRGDWRNAVTQLGYMACFAFICIGGPLCDYGLRPSSHICACEIVVFYMCGSDLSAAEVRG